MSSLGSKSKFQLGRFAALGIFFGAALLTARPALAGSCGSGSGGGGNGQAGRGFAVQTALGGRLLALSALGAAAPAATPTAAPAAADVSSGFQWNLLLGYKLCRVLLGLNLDLLVTSPVGVKTVATSFLVAPEVQVAIAQSTDRRAELIGMLRFGAGRQGSNVQLGGALAPGVRFWLHPHIALSTQVGLAADVILYKKGQSFYLSMFGTLGVLGSF
jgi:hypothetical protein